MTAWRKRRYSGSAISGGIRGRACSRAAPAPFGSAGPGGHYGDGTRPCGSGHGDAVVVSQRERSERTIAAIVGAGRALMTEAGYAGVTVDDVTARAGVA